MHRYIAKIVVSVPDRVSVKIETITVHAENPEAAKAKVWAMNSETYNIHETRISRAKE